MKRITSMFVTMIMMLSLATNTFATTVNTETTKDVTVSFGTSESFVVIIPTDFVIDENMTATADVKAYDVMIDYGNVLEVTVNGADYADTSSWELENISAEEDTLTYIIGTEEGMDDIIDGSVVLSVQSKEAVNTEKVETMYFTVIDKIESSGEYMDTLTFYVDVIGNNNKLHTLSEIVDKNGNGHIEVGNKVQLEIPTTYRSRTTPTWESSNTSVLSINNEGVATALRTGTVVITYTYGEETGEIHLTIYAANSLVYFGIEDSRYFARKNMTWEAWLNSEFNTENYEVWGDLIVFVDEEAQTAYIVLENDDACYKTDIITNSEYGFSHRLENYPIWTYFTIDRSGFGLQTPNIDWETWLDYDQGRLLYQDNSGYIRIINNDEYVTYKGQKVKGTDTIVNFGAYEITIFS